MNKLLLILGVFLLSASVASAAEDGEKLFKAKCAACHGADGKGKTKQGAKMKIGDMTSADWKKDFGTADKVKEVVEKGLNREKEGVKQEMKSFKGKVTPEQLDAIAEHAVALK
jgi:mono/diheme cytochrome c family protein